MSTSYLTNHEIKYQEAPRYVETVARSYQPGRVRERQSCQLSGASSTEITQISLSLSKAPSLQSG